MPVDLGKRVEFVSGGSHPRQGRGRIVERIERANGLWLRVKTEDGRTLKVRPGMAREVRA